MESEMRREGGESLPGTEQMGNLTSLRRGSGHCGSGEGSQTRRGDPVVWGLSTDFWKSLKAILNCL